MAALEWLVRTGAVNLHCASVEMIALVRKQLTTQRAEGLVQLEHRQYERIELPRDVTWHGLARRGATAAGQEGVHLPVLMKGGEPEDWNAIEAAAWTNADEFDACRLAEQHARSAQHERVPNALARV